MSQIADLVGQWIDGYDARDAAAQAALYAEDASNWQHALGEPVIGRDKIRAGLAAFYRAFPDSAITSEAMIEDEGRAALFWRAGGTWRGPFAGLEPNGKSYVLYGSTLFIARSGRIVEQRAYWDRATLFRQLDIPL